MMDNIEEERRKIMYYTAIDNEVGLKAFLIISKQPNISFNEISRRLKVNQELLAYHLGVLKAAGLITLDYEVESRKISKYRLTEEGEKFLQELYEELKLKKEDIKKIIHKYRL